jgi:hypothetical protein
LELELELELELGTPDSRRGIEGLMGSGREITAAYTSLIQFIWIQIVTRFPPLTILLSISVSVSVSVSVYLLVIG